MILSDKSIRELCTGDFVARHTVPVTFDKYGKVETERILGEIRNESGKPMISPFSNKSVKEDEDGNRIISWGLSSYGYDIRLANEFRLFSRPNDGRIIDPKSDNHDAFSEVIVADEIVIPPGGLLLGRTVEMFSIPRDLLVICVGKSTYARVGALVNVTPLEPEWEGNLVLEITNGTNLPLKIYANEGIAQLVFHVGDQECEVSYKDRGGKYQGQTGVTTAKV
jgi:dCTP deaminase